MNSGHRVTSKSASSPKGKNIISRRSNLRASRAETFDPEAVEPTFAQPFHEFHSWLMTFGPCGAAQLPRL